MIELKNVSKRYKNKTLFQNITVSFPSNKKIYIRGINGSGKSVLLKLITGYSRPTEGKIFADEIEIGEKQDFIPNAGVSINAPEFIRSYTGLENLLELAAIRKIADERQILDLAKRLDFEEDVKKKYSTFSLGMKQKMRLIQALMDKPKYLILDEPFDALDKKSKAEVITILEEYLCEQERYLIFTGHDDSLEQFADIIYELELGKLEKVR